MSDLPTRVEAQEMLDGSVPEALELELVGALLMAYVAGELITRQSFIEDLNFGGMPEVDVDTETEPSLYWFNRHGAQNSKPRAGWLEEGLKRGWAEPVHLDMEAAEFPVLDSLAMVYSAFGTGEHNDLMKRPQLVEMSRIVSQAVIEFAFEVDTE